MLLLLLASAGLKQRFSNRWGASASLFSLVLVMKNDSNSYYALDGFHRSAAIISALILCFLFLASPAQANYIYDNKTGTWTPTSRTVIAPAGASSPFNHVPRESPPTVSSTGAFQTKTGGTFGSPPVNGVSRTVPVTITGTVPKPSVNKALLSRITKGGVAGIAIGYGIETLLGGIGALIEEGGNVVMIPPNGPLIYDPPASGSFLASNNYYGGSHAGFPSAAAACAVTTGCVENGSCTPKPTTRPFGYCFDEFNTARGTYTPVGELVCSSGTSTSLGCVSADSYAPIPPDFLENAINSNYQPHASDYPFLSSDPFMIPTVVQVDPIPRQTLPPVTTTTVDLDTGKTTTVETNIWQDFNIKDNNTSQPKIDADITTQTDTYQDGAKTQSSTTTTSTGVGSEPSASAGGSSSPAPEMPIDCDLFPTACAWMEWTKEEPQEPQDNLSDLLKEVPITKETFTISGGAAACPAPIVLNLSQFGSREVSYQPLCDLASTMKFLYLALMSFAAAVLLHRSISRV